MTECTQSSFSFAALYRREVVAEFDGGDITTDAGWLPLREVDRRLRLTERVAACFSEHRGEFRAALDELEHAAHAKEKKAAAARLNRATRTLYDFVGYDKVPPDFQFRRSAALVSDNTNPLITSMQTHSKQTSHASLSLSNKMGNARTIVESSDSPLKP